MTTKQIDAPNLMPESIAALLPSINRHRHDPIVYLKLFVPDSTFEWYITEYDPEERLCFGFVRNNSENEFAYFLLNQLESGRGLRAGQNVQLDLKWQPKPLSEIVSTWKNPYDGAMSDL